MIKHKRPKTVMKHCSWNICHGCRNCVHRTYETMFSPCVGGQCQWVDQSQQTNGQWPNVNVTKISFFFSYELWKRTDTISNLGPSVFQNSWNLDRQKLNCVATLVFRYMNSFVSVCKSSKKQIKMSFWGKNWCLKFCHADSLLCALWDVEIPNI